MAYSEYELEAIKQKQKEIIEMAEAFQKEAEDLSKTIITQISKVDEATQAAKDRIKKIDEEFYAKHGVKFEDYIEEHKEELNKYISEHPEEFGEDIRLL